jgi:hypothetical protein
MFDTARFLKDKFRDPHGVVGFMTTYGVAPPPTDTVRKWFARDTVPADWLPVLLVLIEIDTGAPVSLAEYLK